MVRIRPFEEWVAQGECLSFAFLEAGAGRCVNGTTGQDLAPRDVLVLNGAARVKVVCHPDSGDLVFRHFALGFENLLPLFAPDEISLARMVNDSFRGYKLYPASSPVATACHRLLSDVPRQFDLEHRSQLLRAAAVIFSLEFRNARNERHGFIRVDEHVTQVLERLSIAEILGLSVDELAARFSCSRRHLNRLFHQYFGLSVATLRMEMRLLKAVALLRDPTIKIIHLAEECGFNHLGLFNTCFKRRFGVTPGQWRKNAPQSALPAGSKPDGEDSCRLRTMGLCPWAPELACSAPASGDNGVAVGNGKLPKGTDRANPRNGNGQHHAKSRGKEKSGVQRATEQPAGMLKLLLRP